MAVTECDTLTAIDSAQNFDLQQLPYLLAQNVLCSHCKRMCKHTHTHIHSQGRGRTYCLPPFLHMSVRNNKPRKSAPAQREAERFEMN